MLQTQAEVPCLDENTAIEFVQGLLSDERSQEIEVHISECSECMAVLAELVRNTPLSLTAPPPAPDPENAVTLRRGSNVGRYTILDVIGAGSMGLVYGAYDPQLDRKIAIKFWRTENQESSLESRTRLMREARMLARLSHPNVVTLHDVGELDGRVFLAMEYVDGPSLAGWLKEKEHDWRELLRVIMKAGEGLAAAHAAGLVHRDFKPQNVLIGSGERVLVTDFGLAQPDAELSARDRERVSLARDLKVTSTKTECAGTPAFMAPEQFRGEPADARSDQFSFCVTAYEVLYGQRPFAGESLAELQENLLKGNVPSPPAESAVPVWVRKLLLRGLSTDPNDRFESMRALLDALGRDPSRARRRGKLAILAVFALVALVVGIRRFDAQDRSRVCAGAEQKLVGVWDNAAKERTHRAFVATGVAYAEDEWKRSAAVIDKYARDWVAMHTDACEATRVHGEQSSELLDLRMSCLHDRLREINGLVHVFESADKVVVSNAVGAAESLTQLDRCADAATLTAVVKPPSDPATVTKVEELRERLATVKSLTDAGKYNEAMPLVSALADGAMRTGYREIQAASFTQWGWLAREMGHPKEAVEKLEKAVGFADGARDDVLRATALNELMEVSGSDLQDFDRARELNEQAGLAIERLGGDDRLQAQRLEAFALTFFTRDPQQAIELHKKALALRESIGGENREVIRILNNIGTNEGVLRHFDAEEKSFARALEISEDTLGPSHPWVAVILANLGELFYRQHRFEESLRYEERALSIAKGAYDENSDTLAFHIANVARAYLGLGNYAKSIEMSQRAIASYEAALGPNAGVLCEAVQGLGEAYLLSGQASVRDAGASTRAVEALERALPLCSEVGNSQAEYDIAETQFFLARALVESKKDAHRARALAKEARGFYAKEPEANKNEIAEIDAWLAAKS